MEHKNELGRIYGSRISNSGKYLNLIVAATINGEEVKITCPVALAENYDEVGGKKPYARLEKACTADGVQYIEKAVIANLPVYEDKKPEAKAGEGEKKPLFQQGEPQDDLPF